MNSNTQCLHILQYNVNHSNHKIQAPFLAQADPRIHSVIAIQEPWINPANKKTISLPGYYTVLPEAEHPRTVIYVSKEISSLHWSAKEHSGDLVSIRIQTEGNPLNIHNCYNPSGPTSDHNLGTLPLAKQALQEREGEDHILLGDFNLHHPYWGGNTTQDQHWAADYLINMITQTQMDLMLEPGTITWETPRSCQTLDLVFGSQNLSLNVQECRTREDLETGSDHIPIQTTIVQPVFSTQEKPLRPQWKSAPWEEINTRIEEQSHQLSDSPLDTPEDLDKMAEDIQHMVTQVIEKEVPTARPSQYAKMSWSQENTRMVQQTRRLKREWKTQRTQQSYQAYLVSSQAKGKQIKKDRNLAWRKTVQEVTQDQTKIWKLAKWAREKADQKTPLPQFPAIENQEGTLQHENQEKAQALAQHFFPALRRADLQDIAQANYPPPAWNDGEVIYEELDNILKHLPTGKAAGPDKIPSILLKNCRTSLSPLLSKLFTACIEQGHHPKPFKHSITVVLRKPQKPDHTKAKAYRPIALLNTIAKTLEAIVARRISKEAEARGLLPSSQMGARPGRSTTTALELITEQVYTVWRTNPNMVASMLCLDISGAFDNVSHERLIYILRMKGLPQNTIRFIRSFLQDRTTCLRLGEYMDQPRAQETGIPQGSTLSPILFLFFASTLLPLLEGKNVTAMGFVDDTNILVYGDSTEANCSQLEEAHNKCIQWADKHGASFAPQKYQLIHFSRSRTRHNMTATVNIPGFQDGSSPHLRLLGVWVDSKLRWGPHIKKAAEKGATQLQSLQRLCKSTWGASFQKARHLYTAIVRPTFTFGAKYGWHKKVPKDTGKD